MLRLSLSSKAECTDGRCGDMVGVLLERQTRKLVSYVVRDSTSRHAIERLVPRELGDTSDPDVLRLSCTLAELTNMRPLTAPEVATRVSPEYVSGNYFYPYDMGYTSVPTTPPQYTFVERPDVPTGSVLVRYEMTVEALKGNVGKTTALVLDDDSCVTHFYTRVDHRGSSSDLFLPVSAVSYVDESTVYLRLDSEQIKSLPRLPSQHSRFGSPPPYQHVELAAKVFSEPDGATRALEYLRQIPYALKIREAAILVSDADGKISITDASEASILKSGAVGMAAGGLVAMLGPIGLVAGMAGGAVIGGFVGPKLDLGFPDAFLRRLQEHLQPGHSGLVVLVEYDWRKGLAEALGQVDGVISQDTIVDTLVEEMLAENSAAENAPSP